MEDASETSYWCHMCSRSVIPLIQDEIIKCNFCQSGFVEEMDNNDDHQAADSLWTPILMEMMNNNRDQHSTNQEDSESILEDEDEDEDDGDDGDQNNDGEIDITHQLEEIRRIRTRHSTAIVNLLQGIRAGLLIESENNEDNPDNSELVVLINSFNQRIRVHQDSVDTTSVPSGSLGDYFIGPGFETLLQRLAENDLNNRYGTPPATKEAVEALAMVKIEDSLLQCSVCLDDFEIGMEAKEMPCKHKFHSDCLLPWLELHSSCPVCRYLLPTGDDDEPKTDAETSRNDDNNEDISNASMASNGSSPDSSSNNSSVN
uniref:RING-type E3 ubiquitin transferase n=1 Tax=Arabidopsis thaliana TaxID=3702 RepID=Q6NMJ8_ARATH|nr:At3g13430 [Arabidopsis thaliana]AAS47667.1 At3g13430 [Arabidopsis thaliana]